MNIPADVRLQQLNTNVVRLQSMSGDLGRRYVVVNIPAAYIEAVENGSVATRHTAVVGRISRQTHIVNSKIYEVILNPYWTAPRSIVQKDIMPLMRKDPNYLKRNAIRLLRRQGQRSGARNGRLECRKGAEPDVPAGPRQDQRHGVDEDQLPQQNHDYMHDTPQQGLFNKLMRFELSGCVRVQNVRDLSTWLLRETPGWSRQQMEATIATGVNTPIKLAEEVPVYFVYITAWSATDGIVQFRDDIYQLDGAPNWRCRRPTASSRRPVRSSGRPCRNKRICHYLQSRASPGSAAFSYVRWLRRRRGRWGKWRKSHSAYCSRQARKLNSVPRLEEPRA